MVQVIRPSPTRQGTTIDLTKGAVIEVDTGSADDSELEPISRNVVPRWRRTYRVRGDLPVTEPTVSVVIPTLNEAKNLPYVLERLPDMVSEVVIVDGRSTDDTVAVARELAPECVVVLETRPGKGVALRSGFAAATGDIIVMLDADGSTDPVEIPAFVGNLVAGADLVKGSRFMQGGGTDDMEIHRKMGNQALTTAVNLAFGGSYSDLCYGYVAFWRDVLPLMELDVDGFEIETLIGIRALRAGLEVAEVPSFECPRIHGSSNLQAIRDGFRILRHIILERLKPFRPGAAKRVAPALTPIRATAWLRSLLGLTRR
jgi:glycosyltransferase involved in cell wall biosynthesis